MSSHGGRFRSVRSGGGDDAPPCVDWRALDRTRRKRVRTLPAGLSHAPHGQTGMPSRGWCQARIVAARTFMRNCRRNCSPRLPASPSLYLPAHASGSADPDRSGACRADRPDALRGSTTEWSRLRPARLTAADLLDLKLVRRSSRCASPNHAGARGFTGALVRWRSPHLRDG